MKRKCTLSEQELDILQLIAEEFTLQQIADRLHLKKDNVDYHCRQIRKWTGCHTCIGAYRKVLLQGIIPLR